MGMTRSSSICLMKSMASCTVGLTTMSSHTQVGRPSSTHTTLLPACMQHQHQQQEEMAEEQEQEQEEEGG